MKIVTGLSGKVEQEEELSEGAVRVGGIDEVDSTVDNEDGTHQR